MKRGKHMAVLAAAAWMICALSACGSREFETVRSFSYHFLKEEYDEEYRTVEKTIALDDESNYEIRITSSGESGTIAMALRYTNEDGEEKMIHITSPAAETVAIAGGTTASVTFRAEIGPDTQGRVTVEIARDGR